ncbi:MAG: threonine--tRNA ligase [Thermodesulfobacteriota bacterium]
MKITITGGEEKEFEAGSNVGDILDNFGLKDKCIGAKINGSVVDFWHSIEEDSEIEPVKTSSEDGLQLIRHTAAHVMAEAVQSLYPEAKVTIGPVIENGFYYDFDFSRGFTPEDLEKIEEKMNEIIKENKPLTRKTVSRDEAIEIFTKNGENYKIEIIEDLPEAENITIYDQDTWYDLCRGPHAPSTGLIKSFKLTSSAGAYWRGNENNPMLQRIYGTAFWDRKELKRYLTRLEEAKKRDHRKLGKELDLFSIQDEIGSGLVLWHPRGSRIRKIIEDFWRQQHEKSGYELLYTPHVAKLDLWKISGHTDFYSENMFSPMDVDNQQYQLKPMNCPFHCMIYKTKIRSYRDLPLRWAEIGTVYRYERSGVLHGLLRVRGFSQDDAHIFCSPDQIKDEVLGVMDLTTNFLKTFGFDDYEIYLSTRPKKFVGTEEDWEKATDAIKDALETLKLDYEIDEGGGAFYGPKIDLKIKDVIGRSWQCSTVQVDFNLPKRFDMNFVGDDNARHTPIMIHRAVFGSIERFFGILIEHYGGAFPFWLSPEQIRVATVADEHNNYADSVYDSLRELNFRVEKDYRNEKLGYKVREAQLMKIPYLLVIGSKEVESGTVAPRIYGGDSLDSMSLDEFINMIKKENNKGLLSEVEEYSEI